MPSEKVKSSIDDMLEHADRLENFDCRPIGEDSYRMQESDLPDYIKMALAARKTAKSDSQRR